MTSPHVPTDPPARNTPGQAFRARQGSWSGAELWLLPAPTVDGDRDRLAKLAPQRILSSPLAAPLELATALGERTHAPLEIHPDLRETDLGRWRGRCLSDLEQEEPDAFRSYLEDPWTYRGHGGESDSGVSSRAWPPVLSGLGRVAGGRLLVTTHAGVLRVLIAEALGIPPVHSFALRVDPGQLCMLRDSKQGWQLVHLNRALPPTARPATRVGART